MFLSSLIQSHSFSQVDHNCQNRNEKTICLFENEIRVTQNGCLGAGLDTLYASIKVFEDAMLPLYCLIATYVCMQSSIEENESTIP
mmetsp:Transcript_24629/g.57816  ORF Transcript_24629/g.57816 Transcript_24629/m.57816 type:complete len:86 (+) Transcript_24629:127-384(+)